MSNVLDIARAYRTAGLSVVPIKTDGTKAPACAAWADYGKRIASEAELQTMFGRNGVGVAIVGCLASGNLEILDIDDPAIVEPFLLEVEAAAPGLLARLPQVQTPRPGRHIYYRHTGEPEVNLTLAETEPVPQFDKRTGEPDMLPSGGQRVAPSVLIETRGGGGKVESNGKVNSGGYVLAPGSPPACHPTGRTYEHVAGPPITEVPTITTEERQLLFSVARTFNRNTPEPVKTNEPRHRGPGLSPGDDFASKTTWEQILEPHGGTKAGPRGDLWGWFRPGKSSGSISATTGLRSKNGNDLLHVFSTNWHPFKNRESYGKFAAYTLLKHAGDFKAACKALAEQGYGDPGQRDFYTGEASLNLWKPEGRTDAANAARFLNRRQQDVRWCDPHNCWYVWAGPRWERDRELRVELWAGAVAAELWDEVKAAAEKGADKKLIDELVKFAKASNSNKGRLAFLEIAKSLVPILPETFDIDPFLFNCRNGTLDLRTGEIREHRRADFLTKLCPTNYNPDAPSLAWDTFQESITAGQQELVDFKQRFYGYALTGDVREQIIVVGYGEGSNGKSTELNAIRGAIGDDYTMAAVRGFLTATNKDHHSTEQYDLRGRRLVAVVETDDGQRLDEGLVKMLTGGESIRARQMRADNEQFSPTHKIIIGTNHLPRIKGTDHATWRRLALVPYSVRFWNPDKGETGPDELQQVKGLPAKLAAEAEGILAWAVRGCLEWQRGGLRMPSAVTMATTAYQTKEDVLGRFVAECCCEIRGATPFKTLYTALEAWCSETGENLPSRKAFSAWLDNKGYAKEPGRTYPYIGIGLRPD